MYKTKSSKFRTARIMLAAVVLCCFVLLFANPGGVFTNCLSWLPKLEFWPAVLAVNVGVLVLITVMTLVLGRIYCSILCPLGIFQDTLIFIRDVFSGKKRRKGKFLPALNGLRYFLMAFFIVSVCAGIGFIADLMEPYSIFGRMMTSLWAKSLPLAAVSVLTIAVILVLIVKWGRIWCNTVCPVGALLGLLSRRSIFAPVFDESRCVGCGLCEKNCRASCINVAEHTVDTSRCLVCFDCVDVCKVGAMDFKLRLNELHRTRSEHKSSMAESDGHSGNGRRAFLTAAALTAGGVAMKAAENAGHGGFTVLEPKLSPERKSPLAPPGAGSYKSFASKCISCQLCVSACPNHVLKPGTSLDASFLRPVMDYKDGFCRPECTACSQVCPTAALLKITPEEKSVISIGHAVYDFDRCVVNTDGVKCGNCARHCPAGAISMIKFPAEDPRHDSDLRIPAVDIGRCIGCGHCEYVCPSRPVSAIYIEGNEIHHKR